MNPGIPDALTAPENRTGTVIASRYRLQRRLAIGGMGEVYEAKHTEIPRHFAVKVLRPELAADPDMRARFRREAEMAASLSSDHIVEIIDFGHAEDGAPYLVMELLHGADLRRLLRDQGILTVEHATAVISQVCAGLASPHQRDIIHRDLKPENLFLARRGERVNMKILDFGIAKLRNRSLGTGSGKPLGTIEYMPPEQVRGDANIDQRADIYALGVILYEALTGQLPHAGQEHHEIISHILFERPAPIAQLKPELPLKLAAAIDRALAANPADRFQTAAELAAALAPFVGPGRLPQPIAVDGPMRPTPPARSSGIISSVWLGVGASRTDAAAAVRAPTARSPHRVVFSLVGIALVVALLWMLQWREHHPVSAAQPPRAQPKTATVVHGGGEVPSSVPTPSPPVSEVEVPVRPAEVPPVGEPEPPAVSRPERTPTHGSRAPRLHSSAPASSISPVAPSQPDVIEVRSNEHTIVFKRDNPLRN